MLRCGEICDFADSHCADAQALGEHSEAADGRSLWEVQPSAWQTVRRAWINRSAGKADALVATVRSSGRTASVIGVRLTPCVACLGAGALLNGSVAASGKMIDRAVLRQVIG